MTNFKDMTKEELIKVIRLWRNKHSKLLGVIGDYYALCLDSEDVMDKTNSDYGSKEEYCIYCKSKEYNSKVGIIHSKECIINKLRKQIKND